MRPAFTRLIAALLAATSVSSAAFVAPGRRRYPEAASRPRTARRPAEEGAVGIPAVAGDHPRASVRVERRSGRRNLGASPSDEEEHGEGDYDSSASKRGDDDSTAAEDGRAWLKEAMGAAADDGEASSTSSVPATIAPLRDGLAGFAVDPAEGFGAVLVSSFGSRGGGGDGKDGVGDGGGGRRAVFAVVSPRDRTTIMSPEALTLIQLAGGIDVAAAVFPPDALRRAAFYDEDEAEKGIGSGGEGAKVTLVGVEAVPSSSSATGETNGDSEDRGPYDSLPPSSPERESKLTADAPRFLAAARNLPGLAGATEADVLAALRIHSDGSGNLDRSAFSGVVDSLRRSLSGAGRDSGVKFVATVAVARGSGEGVGGGALLSTRTLDLPAFMALALSMRHKVAVTVSEEFLSVAGEQGERKACCFGADEVWNRLPAFRPIEELEKDAKAVDGFVPEMFFKHKPPKAEE